MHRHEPAAGRHDPPPTEADPPPRCRPPRRPPWRTALALIVLGVALAGCVVPPSRTGAAAARAAAHGPACGGQGQPICEFAPARFVHKAGCENGAFFDPRNGGECWRCPSGSVRTIFPVTSDRACEQPARVQRSAVVGRHAAVGLLRTDCRPGYFLHGLSGQCYACPAGWRRTVFAIDGDQACETTHAARPQRASFDKRMGCSAPTFPDPRHGGECWQCPTRWNRSIFPVNGAQACTAPAGTACAAGLVADRGRCVRPQACGADGARPCLLTERIPSCNPGLVEDFALNRCVPAAQTVLRRLADEAVAEARPLILMGLQTSHCLSQAGKLQGLAQALQRRDPPGAAASLGGLACVQQLRQAAARHGYQTVTLGIGADAGLGIGVNSELGLAIDVLDRRRARVYSTLGYSLGANASISGALVVGFAKSVTDDLAGDGHGIAYSVKAVEGAGVGVGFDYQNRLQSVAVSGAVGLGASVGVYSRTKTVLVP